jgi:hypothetical protein
MLGEGGSNCVNTARPTPCFWETPAAIWRNASSSPFDGDPLRHPDSRRRSSDRHSLCPALNDGTESSHGMDFHAVPCPSSVRIPARSRTVFAAVAGLSNVLLPSGFSLPTLRPRFWCEVLRKAHLADVKDWRFDRLCNFVLLPQT